MPTASPARISAFNSAEFRRELARLREVDNVTNLRYLAFEYLCLAATIAGAVAFGESRGAWGIAWGWNVPVFAVAIFLIGGLQHRLAGLGHESAHYSLLKNKWANDFVGDLFCLIPVLSSVQNYRIFHMAHHQYTNDPRLDPDLAVLGPGKRVDEFPMGRLRFVLTRFLAPLTSPASFVLYQWEYVLVNVLGRGENVYHGHGPGGEVPAPRPRLGLVLGVAYVLGMTIGQNVLTRVGLAGWLIPSGLAGLAVVIALCHGLPDRFVAGARFRQPYSVRSAGVIRLGAYTAGLVGMGLLREATGGRSTPYVYLLWFVPLCTTFPYFMLLRDTYQHTNADDGRLTNTRVFFCDPLTRWAVFVYGQDMHLPHHLFPAIPHHRLGRLHRLLRSADPAYAREVVECRGTFANGGGAPTILDVLSSPPVPRTESDPQQSHVGGA